MGLFDKLKQKLTRTRESIADKVDALVTGYQGAPIDDEFYEDMTDILIMADVGVRMTTGAIDEMKSRVKAEKAKDPARARDILKEILVEHMTAPAMPLPSPTVLMIIGVNGVGKTTTIGKLATRYKALGRNVILCAADTFRAAAADQLQIWAERANVPLIRHKEGADPAAVLFDAVSAAKGRGADVLIVDTAGRLHNKTHLMEELKKMARVVEREFPGANFRALLIIDATTGQNGLAQAKVFKDVTTLDGIILTKLDGTAKGGIVIAIESELGLPVQYVGIGEGLDDLQPFDAKEYIDAII